MVRRILLVAALLSGIGLVIAACGETVLVLVPSDAGATPIDPRFGDATSSTGCVQGLDSNRCLDGAVIIPDAEAPHEEVDASGCVDGVCKISCTNCSGTICPPGLPCEITCIGPNSCVNIDCGRASSCKITCKGGNNCTGIRCVTPSCMIRCENDNACAGAIVLAGANSKLECVGARACAAPVTCCAEKCDFKCPGDNCTGGLCCKQGADCKGDKSATTCSDVACSF